MRCTTCAALHFRDLQNCSLRLHDSPEDLKASAERGCDFCALCWALCVQKRLDKNLAYNDNLEDKSVWLEGYIYPSQNYNRLMENQSVIISPNGLEICIGSFTLGDSYEKNIERITIGQLPIFADPGTPASETYLETWTTVDRNPQGYIDFAKQSMSRCKLQHKLCAAPSSDGGSASQLPTRLIEVGEFQGRKAIRLVITQESKDQFPYLALSYCWGENAESMMKLRRDNIEELQSYIDEERLSKTHRDAFQVTRDLGYRYIWIDALCIIQGDKKADKADWEYESTRMQQVYSHAALTIVAGRAADSRDGFLENKTRQAAGPCAIPFCQPALTKWHGVIAETVEMGNIQVALPRSVEDGPLSKRAWCFQEAILSPRALVFGKEQLYFRCREISIWEDGHVKRSPFYEIQNARSTFYASTSPPLDSLGQGDEDMRRRMLIFWYVEVLWHFTGRETTNPDDVFAALSGVAQVAKSEIRSRYLGGLWEVDMVRGLLWKPRHVYLRGPNHVTGCHRRSKIPRRRGDINIQAKARPVEAPSWSWAAVQGQVGVDHVNRNEPKYHISNALIRPKYEGRWTWHSACHAKAVHIMNCELEFFGRPRRVKTLQNQQGRLGWKSLNDYKSEQYYGGRVNLMPVCEETNQNSETNSQGNLDHIVATGFFDVAEERVSTCWCIPVTKEEGLILTRDETGKFRRAGTMRIKDLAWMTSVDEEEICLV